MGLRGGEILQGSITSKPRPPLVPRLLGSRFPSVPPSHIPPAASHHPLPRHLLNSLAPAFLLSLSLLPQAANYPFCTIEPNTGMVTVPDPRLQILSNISGSKELVRRMKRGVSEPLMGSVAAVGGSSSCWVKAEEHSGTGLWGSSAAAAPAALLAPSSHSLPFTPDPDVRCPPWSYMSCHCYGQPFHIFCHVLIPPSQIPTTVEFVDIAGLVKGASKGEGMGNQFLTNIRDTNAVCQVGAGEGELFITTGMQLCFFKRLH